MNFTHSIFLENIVCEVNFTLKFYIMKKLILSVVITVFTLFNLNAQNFNASISPGLPIGDAGDLANFSMLLDVNYLFEVSEDFNVGPNVGYSISFLDKDFDGDDIQFLPLAAAGRYSVSEEFILGADVGYAVGINDGNDGGFYYCPKIQYNFDESIGIVAAYRGVSLDGDSFDIISFGVEFGF